MKSLDPFAHPVERFASLHYDHLVAQGSEMAQLSPITTLTAPLEGTVLWRNDDKLQGYSVKADTAENLFPLHVEWRTLLGLTPQMQALGIWSVQRVVYTPGARGEAWQQSDHGGRLLAHYTGQDWQVRRALPGVNANEADPDMWQAPQNQIEQGEKAAIHRIANEGLFVLDAAASFRDRLDAYYALHRALRERAHASGNPQDVLAIETLLDPYGRLPEGIGSQFHATIYQLADLAMPLYRALIGKRQADASGIALTHGLSTRPGRISSLITARESFCPPYEEVIPQSEPPTWKPIGGLQKAIARLRRLLLRGPKPGSRQTE